MSAIADAAVGTGLFYRSVQMSPRASQADSPSMVGVRFASGSERGPPTQPVMVFEGSGKGVHQTGGMEAKEKRKLKSPLSVPPSASPSTQNFSRNTMVKRRAF